MADRDELIEHVEGALKLWASTDSSEDPIRALAGVLVDGGLVVAASGDGRRIAIIEPMNDRSGQQIRFGDGLMAEQAWRLIVTPDPEEGPVLLDYGGEPCGDEEGQ